MARTVVLRRLNSAPRTRKDLYDDLISRDIAPGVVDEVLDRFTEVGLINDAEYAQMFVASRQRSRGTARPVLRQELRRKGVQDDDIQDALDEITDEQEYARARALVQAKLPALARYDSATRQRRLMGLLMRRGYRGGLAASVIREVTNAEIDIVIDES